MRIVLINNTQGGNVDEAEKAFIKGATERGLLGLKGHRSVGGKSTTFFLCYHTNTNDYARNSRIQL